MGLGGVDRIRYVSRHTWAVNCLRSSVGAGAIGIEGGGTIMSWVAAAYVKKLRVDMDGKKLTKGHKLILFVLADYHNEERGDAWTSLRHMAIESLHSRTGLIRSLGELEKGGVIRVLRHHDAVKNRIINRYVFPALDSIASAVTTPDLVAPVHHPSRASTPPLVAPVHHPQSRQYTTPSRASTPYLSKESLSEESLQRIYPNTREERRKRTSC